MNTQQYCAKCGWQLTVLFISTACDRCDGLLTDKPSEDKQRLFDYWAIVTANPRDMFESALFFKKDECTAYMTKMCFPGSRVVRVQALCKFDSQVFEGMTVTLRDNLRVFRTKPSVVNMPDDAWIAP